MKNIFKFAAVVFATVAFAGGMTSCESDTTEELTISRKQWIATTLEDGACGFVDVGFTKVGTAYSGYCNPETLILENEVVTSLGEYTVNATDATSGSINVNSINEETEEEIVLKFYYKDLTATSVSIDYGIVSGVPSDRSNIQYVKFVLAAKTIQYNE